MSHIDFGSAFGKPEQPHPHDDSALTPAPTATAEPMRRPPSRSWTIGAVISATAGVGLISALVLFNSPEWLSRIASAPFDSFFASGDTSHVAAATRLLVPTLADAMRTPAALLYPTPGAANDNLSGGATPRSPLAFPNSAFNGPDRLTSTLLNPPAQIPAAPPSPVVATALAHEVRVVVEHKVVRVALAAKRSGAKMVKDATKTATNTTQSAAKDASAVEQNTNVAAATLRTGPTQNSVGMSMGGRAGGAIGGVGGTVGGMAGGAMGAVSGALGKH